MQTRTATAGPEPRPGPWSIRAGWVLSGLVVLFLVMDSAMKIPPLQPVIDTMGPLGWPTDAGTTRTLALLLLASTGLYVWRPTRWRVPRRSPP